MDRIWRSKTTLASKKDSKTKMMLPSQISTKIIELQMQMDEGEINKQLILQMIQYYTKAIQFFEEKEDQRYILYQKKLQSYLQKPMINKILNGGQTDLLFKKQKNQEQIRKASTQNKVIAKRMLQLSELEADKQHQKIQKQIHSQIQNLQQRKRIRSQRNKLTASFSASTQPDTQMPAQFYELKPPTDKNQLYQYI